MQPFEIKDSGERQEFDSGMVRDTAVGQVDYDRVLDGPLFVRWAEHLTNATAKYPDDPDTGDPNWLKANSKKEWRRFRRSLFRHTVKQLLGFRDEDHAAAICFNANGMEYVRERMTENANQP